MKLYQEKIRIKSYQTNQYGKVSVTTLFNYMLEAAWAHAQVMDWGYDQLKNNKLFWVLSRMYIEFGKFPSWQDEIVLNTWSAGTDGMYAYREYILENEKGELILKASTAWLILEQDSKKIFMLREYRDTFPKNENQEACRNPKRIKPPTHPERLVFNPVRFSELDVNMHFNSVRCFERMLDGFGIDFLGQYEPEAIEVNYLKEGLAGDSLAVFYQEKDELEHIAAITRESDGADLCAMKINWRLRQ